MDCFGTYLTHAQTCVDIPVQSAAGWTAWQWRFARRNENVADVTAQTLLKLTWWKNKDAAAKCILVRKQSGFFINICSSYFQILFPWHDVLSTNTRRKQKMICFLLALLARVAKNHCFTTTELRLVFPQPSKNFADFEGFYRIEFSSRCGKRQLFCNSQ